MELKEGKNSLSFSVTSSFAGKATCTAHMFYWKWNVPVVISDIDGTITKYPPQLPLTPVAPLHLGGGFGTGMLIIDLMLWDIFTL